MQSFIKVTSAVTRQGLDIQNYVFRMLDTLKRDKDGMYIVVDGTPHPELRNGRTRLYLNNPLDYSPITAEEAEKHITRSVAEEVDTKTDVEIATEIRETFDILGEMTKAVASNIVKGLVVSGPAGIGKSHTVETTLHRYLGMLGMLRDGLPQYEVITGSMSPAMLYEKLWNYKEEGQVLVFDDCDGIFYDIEALNLLKAALDSKKTRNISWNYRSLHLERQDIPKTFEYKGGIIFITNIDFNNVNSPKLSIHLKAISSRCHYLDIGVTTLREKIIHIKNVIDRNNMFHEYGFKPEEKNEVINYIEVNADKFRELSLRSVIKLADLKCAMPERWIKFANKNLLKLTA